ncbi:hypothetical protein Bca4012_016757 [Brassica carinata]|uniref:Uncharacterized protein n=1 Tax=Brassica carinata TaxID=52824 RepID=A0A8X8BFT9_BRACI|nr:hypothetical protein Bca52824_004847 [Brassica carinata]
MNDHQSILMNPLHTIAQHPQQRMNPPQHSQLMNPVQPRILNQAPLLNQSQNLNHPIMVMNQQMNNNNNQPLMMNPRNFNPNQPNNSFGTNHSKTNRINNSNNWKGKKITTDARPPPMYNPGGYKPPTLNELQSQNRLKTKKFYPKKKYGGNNNRYVPYAPRNTTSFIIRAKKSGGIAELVSPCPVTPAILPTPMFSLSREVLGDMAKEEWGAG